MRERHKYLSRLGLGFRVKCFAARTQEFGFMLGLISVTHPQTKTDPCLVGTGGPSQTNVDPDLTLDSKWAGSGKTHK